MLGVIVGVVLGGIIGALATYLGICIYIARGFNW